MSDRELYAKVCQQHPEIPVFCQPWWLESVAGTFDAAIMTKGEHVIGIWPYIPEQKIGVRLLRTPLLTPYLGPVVLYPPDIKPSNRDSFEHETIAGLLQQLPHAPVWSLALNPGLKQAGLLKNYGLQPTVRQTFRLNLAADEAAIFADMKDTLRRNIKQAEKAMVITQEPGQLPLLLSYYQKTLSRKDKSTVIGLPMAERLLQQCIAHQAGNLWVAREAGVVAAIVWQVWDQNTSYYLMGAQNPDGNGYKAMSLLLWHCIGDAKRTGRQYFDLEGSMDAGVERFYRGFGGERELYMVVERNDAILWKAKGWLRG